MQILGCGFFSVCIQAGSLEIASFGIWNVFKEERRMIQILCVSGVHRILCGCPEAFAGFFGDNFEFYFGEVAVDIDDSRFIRTKRLGSIFVFDWCRFGPAAGDEDHFAGFNAFGFPAFVMFNRTLRRKCIVGILRKAEEIPDTVCGNRWVVAAVVVDTDPHGHAGKTLAAVGVELFPLC